jgi:hypothetical protein
MTTPTVTSKTHAGLTLLNRAIDLYIDHQDYLSALVLAGAAEDIFHGHLVRLGKETARQNMATAAVKIAKRLDPSGKPRSERNMIDAMRWPFNWPRHNDREDDPEEVELDWEEEAWQVLNRAISDMMVWTNDLPLRVAELDRVRKEREC